MHGQGTGNNYSPLKEGGEIAERAKKLEKITSLEKKGTSTPDSESELVVFCLDPDPLVEASAAGCLLSLHPGEDDACKALTKLLRHRNPAVRLAALQAAGNARAGAVQLLPELIITLQGDVSPFVRDKAAWAIGQSGTRAKSAIPTVIDALKKNHPLEDFHGGRDLKSIDDTIYKTCIVTLGKIGYGSNLACKTLVATCSDSSKEILQEPALKALYALGAGALIVLPDLTELLAREQPARKIELIKLIKHIGPAASDALPRLQECMKSEDPKVRRAALDAILTISSNEKQKQELLLGLTTDSDASLKEAAKKALASSTALDPDTLKTLMDKAEHGKNDERLASMKTLAAYGSLAAGTLPVLIKTYISTDVTVAQRKAAFDTIKKLDPSGLRTIPLVKENLDDPFKSRASIELLEFIGGPACEKIVQQKKDQWHMGRTIK